MSCHHVITVQHVSQQQHTGVSTCHLFISYLNEMLVDPFSERLLLHRITVICNTAYLTITLLSYLSVPVTVYTPVQSN